MKFVPIKPQPPVTKIFCIQPPALQTKVPKINGMNHIMIKRSFDPEALDGQNSITLVHFSHLLL